MWHVFGRPRESVAIVSTVGKLQEAITNELSPQNISEGTIGEVAYSKMSGEIQSVADIFFYKRPAYAWEHEIRAVLVTPDILACPIYLHPIYLGYSALGPAPKLGRLVEEVIVAPGCYGDF